MPLVLHIVCNMGGGLAAAVHDYSASTPEVRHILLCEIENTYRISPENQSFERILPLPTGRVSTVREIRRQIRVLEPDIIHAHSSYAGAFVRAVAPRRLAARVVYTPHGYSFFRTDIGRLTRRVYFFVEKLLTGRCATVIACSPSEEKAAENLGATAFYVPNIAPARPALGQTTTDRPVIVGMGRMCAQKDPLLFIEAARRARSRNLNFHWLWIGGGQNIYERAFDEAGIEYTGWVDRKTAVQYLRKASMYVHTAKWEGAPLTILEAASVSVPTFARDIPTLRGLGLKPMWRSVDDLLRLLEEYPQGLSTTQALSAAEDLSTRHTRAKQSSALYSVYNRILGTTLGGIDLREPDRVRARGDV